MRPSARARSRIAASSSSRDISPADESSDLLERWLEEVLRFPGATGVPDLESARSMLLDDAVRAAPIVDGTPGRVVDVGSGGGTPGIPLAVVLPERDFTLLEANRRKCVFLERISAELANVQVVWGRAEDQEIESFGVALAKALAEPPVAAELCLPLVGLGGATILWLGERADRRRVGEVARRLGSRVESDSAGLLVLRKVEPTPPGFPRRAGMARKRPLA